LAVLRPKGAGCAAKVTDTTEDQEMELAAKATGFAPATSSTPLVFRWTLSTSAWRVVIGPPVNVVVAAGQTLVIEDLVAKGNSATLAAKGASKLAFFSHGKHLGAAALASIRTRIVPPNQGALSALLDVSVSQSGGLAAKTSAALVIHRPLDISHDGKVRPAQRYYPTQVSGCIPGGPIGRIVTYKESKAETRQRSFKGTWDSSYKPKSGEAFPLPAVGKLNSLFGVEVDKTVSSAKQITPPTGLIPPGHWAVFYRQTTHLHRVAQVQRFLPCGQTVKVGQIVVSDWKWTAEIATGKSCVPPSKLPPAKKWK